MVFIHRRVFHPPEGFHPLSGRPVWASATRMVSNPAIFHPDENEQYPIRMADAQTGRPSSNHYRG
jgi:hypothetical protein